MRIKQAKWTSDSNEMMELKLVHASDSHPRDAANASQEEATRTFHPEFTYPLFGEEQVVFGYRRPVVRLHYAAGSLATYLGFTYAERIDDDESERGAKAQDVMKTLQEHVPAGFMHDYGAFIETVKRDERTFRPMGEKVFEYQVSGRPDAKYEVFRCSFRTPGFKAYHNRLQLFLLLFIEGASYIEDDDKWEISLVFEMTNNVDGSISYFLVGYTTVYAFYSYPDKKRMRIRSERRSGEKCLLTEFLHDSQFLIFPPYQTNGHGVEDPNDAFQEMRDRNDFRILSQMKAFAGLRAPIDPRAMQEWRRKSKLSKGQVDRCCEMILLRALKANDEEEAKEYRLHVKRRLFRHNEEALMGMAEQERITKLQETYLSVVEGYREILNTTFTRRTQSLRSSESLRIIVRIFTGVVFREQLLSPIPALTRKEAIMLEKAAKTVERPMPTDILSTQPCEITLKILSYLPPADLSRVFVLNSHLHSLANDDFLWQKLCKDRWANKKHTPLTLHPCVDYTYLVDRLTDEEIKTILERRFIEVLPPAPKLGPGRVDSKGPLDDEMHLDDVTATGSTATNPSTCSKPVFDYARLFAVAGAEALALASGASSSTMGSPDAPKRSLGDASPCEADRISMVARCESSTPRDAFAPFYSGKWRSSYVGAEVDARRGRITKDEVMAYEWAFSDSWGYGYVDDGEEGDMIRIKFWPNGTRSNVNKAMHRPRPQPWRMSGNGSVQVSSFPEHSIPERTEDWGWSFSNGQPRSGTGSNSDEAVRACCLWKAAPSPNQLGSSTLDSAHDQDKNLQTPSTHPPNSVVLLDSVNDDWLSGTVVVVDSNNQQNISDSYSQVALPNEYLCITGWGIDDPVLTKKWFLKPGQRVVRFSMTPINYTLSLSAMSQEKLEFVLPAVFTIGPKDDKECLHKYAHLLADTASKRPDHLEELIRGIIEGEMRVIAASLTIEEIFKDRKPVKDSIMHGVQSELDQFGLVIYNANIKYMRLKTHEGAVNQAKVDVAEARYKGDVGEAARKGKTRQENSKIEAATVVLENERKAEIAAAQTDLNLKTTDYNLRVKLAQIDAEKAAELKSHDLQKAIETKKAAAEEERLRATQLAKAKIDAEGVVATADADLYRSKRQADATLYQRTKVEAEAMVAMADADLYSRQKKADAALYASVKEAEGIKAKFEAQAVGLKAISDAFDGNASAMIQYLMMEKGIYQDLAKANAEAVRGLNPKLNIWTTGGGGGGEGGSSGGAGDPLQAIRNMQSLIPLVSGINEMTGITPPSWLGTLPEKGPTAATGTGKAQHQGVNGGSPVPVGRR
ncbi:hypothetical protein HK101_007817 [Irineochytrium annulatum]|nr:hypothetical protein HK101_007817 [Irineochytrium annulatum]